MKKYIIALLPFLFFLNCAGICQTKIFEYNFIKSPSGLQSCHSFIEAIGTHALSLLNNDSIQHFLVTDDSIKQSTTKLITAKEYDTSVVAEKYLYDTYTTATFIGSNTNKQIVEEYYLRSKNITTILTDFSTGEMTITDKLMFSKKEHFVTAFLQNGTYYFLTYFDGSNKIRLYTKSFNAAVTGYTKNLELSKKMLNGKGGLVIKQTLKKFSDIFKLPYSVIENNKDYPLAVTSPLYKIYIQQNKLIFTLDNQNHRTTEVIFDINNYNAEFKEFEQPYNYKEKIYGMSACFTNSFLIDSLLLQVNIINTKFNLSFCNNQSGQVYKSYSALDEEELDIINGDILQKQAKRYKTDTSIVSFKKLIRKIRTNQIAISAQKDTGTLHVIIGATYQKNNSGFAEVALSLAASTIVTLAINNLPNTWGYGIFLFGKISKGNTISFQSLFNNQNFLHVTGDIPNDSVRDKVNQFIVQNDVPDKNTFLTQEKDHYYLGFFQKKDNKFLIYKF